MAMDKRLTPSNDDHEGATADVTGASREIHANEPDLFPHGTPASHGAQMIALERLRQIAVEGWTPEHDDTHDDQSLNFAAQAYCQAAMEPALWPCEGAPCPPMWPWEAHEFKPEVDPVRLLVKAGALIAAEIDRLQRFSESAERDSQSCGRLLVGQGTDTWDPLCTRPAGHAGRCESETDPPSPSVAKEV